MSVPLDPAWESSESFPPKPEGADYGYFDGQNWVACSAEELLQRCSRSEQPSILLAWCPEHARVVTVYEIPLLFRCVQERTVRYFWRMAKIGLLTSCATGALAFLGRRDPSSVALFLILLASVGLVPLARGVLGLRRARRSTPESMATESKLVRYEIWLATRHITYTYVLLAVLMMVAFAEALVGLHRAIPAAGVVKQAVRQGEYWRMFTGVMLHGGVIHFGFNFLAMMGLGRLTEALAGRAHLALVFLLAAFTGSLFGVVLMPKVTSVGASGGLMGLIGFLAVLGYRRQHHLPPGFGKAMALNIALVVVMGAAAYRIIDNAAHVGGLLCGLIGGWLLISKHPGELPLRMYKALAIAGYVALVATILIGAFTIWKIIA